MLPLFDRAYNPTGFHVCGIAEYPLGCIHPLNPYSCERGKNARVLSIFRFAFIFIGNLTIVVSVSILIHHIISRERRMKTNPGDIANNSSIKATWQGISYVAAFMFSWGPWYIWQVSKGMTTWVLLDEQYLTCFCFCFTHGSGFASHLEWGQYRPIGIYLFTISYQ